VRIKNAETIQEAEQVIKSYFLSCDVNPALDAARQHLAQTPQASTPSFCTKRGDKIAVKTPYNQAFIEALKAGIPAPQRAWVAASKEWIVDGAFEESIKALIQTHFTGPARRAA
jgi:hypothetical protein